MLAAAFSLVVAVAGWYYLFNSRAADALRDIEQGRVNRWRAILRRAGGLAMLLLAFCFYALFQSMDDANPRTFLLLTTAVVLLLMFIMVLAAVDVRLTWKLKQRQGKPKEPS